MNLTRTSVLGQTLTILIFEADKKASDHEA